MRRRCAVVTAEAAAADPCAGRPMCMLACEHGFVHDDEGCDTCECAAGASLIPCREPYMCIL